MKMRYGALLMMAGLIGNAHAAKAAQPVVLELFTSQGCSSCPPADALMTAMAQDGSVLPLLFHVSYWNNLGWKDSFATADTTNRQYAYSRSLGSGGAVFTPQLVVNGTESMVGSEEGKVRKAVTAESQKPFPVQAALTPDSSGNLKLLLSGAYGTADIWEVRFVSHATTRIGAGENGGRTLDTVNNVTSIKRLGGLSNKDNLYSLTAPQAPDDGLAVIVQEPGPGRILGWAVYIK